MAKNPFDKYYTQETEIKKTMELVRKHIPLKEITEIIEPAAGDGAFIPEIKKLAEELKVPYKFYDLIPEHPEIEQKDFKDLMKEMEYKKGRVFVGNPPFGNASSLFKRFRNGAMEKGDWAVYIGPPSHWNMKYGLKGMELVYSEHLGGVEYRGLENKKVNTCCNVYKRISGNIVDRRMEMLERDFEINSVCFKKDKNGNRNRHQEKEYDFYLNAWGSIPFLKTDWPLNHSVYFGIRILDEKKRKQAEEYFNNFPKPFEEELYKLRTGAGAITIDWLKQKMIEEFYPTREEMLERDFEIKSIANNTSEEVIKNCSENYDFFINQYSTKETAKLIEDAIIPCWCIKVKNEKLKNKAEIFFREFGEKYREEIKKHTSSGINVRKPFLIEKMIEEFYPTREEMLERDFEIKSIKYWKEGDKLNRGLEKGWEKYEYFLGGFGDGVIGIITKEPKYNISWGFKVLNEDKRIQLEKWLNTFKEKYFEELKKNNSAAAIRIDWLKQKMIEEFYPDIPEYSDTFETIENR